MAYLVWCIALLLFLATGARYYRQYSAFHTELLERKETLQRQRHARHERRRQRREQQERLQELVRRRSKGATPPSGQKR